MGAPRSSGLNRRLTVLVLVAGSAAYFAAGERLFSAEPPSQQGSEATTVSQAKVDANGFLVHEVNSPYQAGRTSIRVLLPAERKEGERYTVVYVLPVEAGTESRYGDGLLEVKKLDLHNKQRVIFVAPTFFHLPWYADHPDKAEIRQEAHLLKIVVPWVEATYPAQADARHRLLLGFSKSGWGAWSLLLRQPDLFGKAAAWDAPLMMDKPGKYGSGDIFGTPENFAKYRIETLLRAKSKELGTGPRLILTGFGSFRDEHVRVHDLMMELKIPHVYQDGPPRKHDWHSGWVAEAAVLLMQNKKQE